MDISKLNQYKEEGWLMNQFHPTLPLIIWNYTQQTQYEQIWDEITLMARGLVTDTDGNIVSRGFPKFFNIEEERHTPTDDFEVFEKLDGQYIGVFWYNGEMVVNSRGSFDSKYVIEAKRILNEKYPYFEKIKVGEYHTICFELIGFEQIVVNYPEIDLILTGIFHNQLDCENILDDEVVKVLNWVGMEAVQRYSGLDYRNIKNLNWENSEGFVVRFSNGQRCKIKFEDYVRLHSTMTGLTTGKIYRALKDGQSISSILENVPDEFYGLVHSVEQEFRNRYFEIEDLSKRYFEYFKPWLDNYGRKYFFDKVSQLLIHPYKSVVISMIDNKFHDRIIWQYLEPEQSVKI